MRALILIALLSSVQVDARSAIAALKSSDPTSRTRAACDLRELGARASDAIPQLIEMLADASPAARRNIA
jgi:HEAT repeat protein